MYQSTIQSKIYRLPTSFVESSSGSCRLLPYSLSDKFYVGNSMTKPNRLEEIKEKYKRSMVAVEEWKDIQWLIEKVERLQADDDTMKALREEAQRCLDLENEVKRLQDESMDRDARYLSMPKIIEKNTELREALDEIRKWTGIYKNGTNTEPFKFFNEIDEIARQALGRK